MKRNWLAGVLASSRQSMRKEARGTLVPQHAIQPPEQPLIPGNDQQSLAFAKQLLRDVRDHLLKRTVAELVEIDLHRGASALLHRRLDEAVDEPDPEAGGALVEGRVRLFGPDHASNIEMRPRRAVLYEALDELRCSN